VGLDAYVWRVFRSVHPRPFGWIAAGGYVENNPGIPRDKPWIINRFSLVYLIDGGGFFQNAAGVKRTVGPGDLMILFPDVAHAYGPGDDGRWHEIYIHFDGPVFHLWRSQRMIDPTRPVYHLEPVDRWLQRFDEILEPFATTPGYEQTLRDVCRLQETLAAALIERQTRNLSDDDRQWLARARSLLTTSTTVTDEDGSPDWDEIARHMGTGYETFRKKFARLEGVAPAKYRMRQLIDRACDLMHEPELTNKQIAFKLGFANEFYFSRRFKQITGTSPRSFRQRLGHAGG